MLCTAPSSNRKSALFSPPRSNFYSTTLKRTKSLPFASWVEGISTGALSSLVNSVLGACRVDHQGEVRTAEISILPTGGSSWKVVVEKTAGRVALTSREKLDVTLINLGGARTEFP